MCTELIDGVLVVREGLRRLRWRHEIDHEPPPGDPDGWQIADLWPNADARREIRRRRADRAPILVVFESDPAVATLPVENVPAIPCGAVVHDADDNLVTISVPMLDWLDKPDRERGREFAAAARATIAGTPRGLLPALITDPTARGGDDGLQFAHLTRAGGAAIAAAIPRLFCTPSCPVADPAWMAPALVNVRR